MTDSVPFKPCPPSFSKDIRFEINYWLDYIILHLASEYSNKTVYRAQLLRQILFPFVGVFQATLADVDHALFSHSRSQHEVSDVMQCFKRCHNDSQCLSFNFEYATVKLSKTCELNGVTKNQDPNHYVSRPGFTYYEKVG